MCETRFIKMNYEQIQAETKKLHYNPPPQKKKHTHKHVQLLIQSDIWISRFFVQSFILRDFSARG